jgi:hypothetical protein
MAVWGADRWVLTRRGRRRERERGREGGRAGSEEGGNGKRMWVRRVCSFFQREGRDGGREK